MCEIQESTATDYAFRLFVKNAVWSHVLAGLAEEIGYDNFKSKVARYQGSAEPNEDALHKVHSAMNRLQK